MKVPTVSPDIWRCLYDAAAKFRDLKPWEWLYDSDLFAIKDPATSQIGYCAIMGAAGEFFGMAVYRGAYGYHLWDKTQMGVITGDSDEALYSQDVLVLELVNRNELDNADKRVEGMLKLKFKSLPGVPTYFSFRSRTPGFAPWYLTEQEAQFLATCLYCATDFAKQRKQNPDFFRGEWGKYPLYCSASQNKEGDIEWEIHWEPPPALPEEKAPSVYLDELEFRRIQKLNCENAGIWQVGNFYIPGTVIDRDKPYFARMVMAVDADSGRILYGDGVAFDFDPVGEMSKVLRKAASKYRILPEKIQVADETLSQIIKPLAEKLGIEIECRDSLSMFNKAKAFIDAQTRRRI